jgi:sugar O-acyltransferase (sialic acid O-acetyltransferase NeuD family)
MTPAGLAILGFGGHARAIGDVAIDLGIARLLFVDRHARGDESFAGFPVALELPHPLLDGWKVVSGTGDGAERERQIEHALQHDLPLTALVSARAYVGIGAEIGIGAFVAHHAHLGPLVSIGRGTIVNTSAVIDHEGRIGDFAHVSVNATIAGRCRIGSHVMIGAGATVIDRIHIADHVVIGAGSTVVADIREPGTYVGCPARLVRR